MSMRAMQNDPTRMRAEKILIVDDDKEYLKHTWRSLERAGFSRLFVASDASKAGKLARAYRPDLALIDLDLGENTRNGLSLLQELRSEQPILLSVILSGDRSSQQLFRAARCGAADYLVKGPLLDVPREVSRILKGERGATPGRQLPFITVDLGYLRMFGLTDGEVQEVGDLVRFSHKSAVPGHEQGPEERALQRICLKLGVESAQQLVRSLAICEAYREGIPKLGLCPSR